MIEKYLQVLFCHMIGDYVLQNDYIAKTKGENWYHLFVHCVLYVLPFYICFGLDWNLMFLFATHFLVDAGKARFKIFTYIEDQYYHYWALLLYLTC